MQVRGDSGDVIARAEGGLRWTSAFGDLNLGLFPMLWGPIPYGDAVFNHRQVPLLLAELDRLPAACGGDWVEQARTLCQVVEQGPHRYLWFVGD
ncbi:hypothetical protein OG413_27205 [Streptomyces sp. NBC_01433]|uniref:hypothetical protein n=1 Tax=Streptomyces sp. NBC_01433 TaxID=2903864 RepID=UPI0022522F80|nr:hypothetical protein [Streptomyces sp. NBC_01433]MCX4678955.1 hypothetical protein [Streptomyces sp. NBC_01433]